jgi:hypothetical protein
MEKRNADNFIYRVKTALMIPLEDKFADEEINLHISSCENLLTSMGVPQSVSESDNPLVEGLILIYVKTFFGFKSDGSVRELPANFDLLTRQLVLTHLEED